MKAIITIKASVNTFQDDIKSAERLAEKIVIEANRWLGVTEAWVEEIRVATPEEALRD